MPVSSPLSRALEPTDAPCVKPWCGDWSQDSAAHHPRTTEVLASEVGEIIGRAAQCLLGTVGEGSEEVLQ